MTRLNERGASAVEFALLLPVLMLILFGIIEFGMVMYSREVLTNVTVTVAGAGGVFPNNLTVSTSYPYQFFAPGILGLGTSITLTTQTVMRHE